MLNNEMTKKLLESLPFINEEQIKSALRWGPLIDAVERAMIDFSAGKVAQPVRQIVKVPGYNAVMSAMPAMGEAMVDNTVLVESCESARNQAGNIRGSGCEIFAEVGEIYSGAKKAPEGITVIYDSVGVAIMDVVAAKLAYDLVLGQ